MYEQHAPFSIQVEFTEGCTMACSFCGINGIREKAGNFKFMTVHTARVIAREIARVEWDSRIEFAMHGEPSWNPNTIELIRIFRKYLPNTSLMMTSNGAGFLSKHKVTDAFKAGLNVLALDDYEHSTNVERVLAKLPGGISVGYYPQDKGKSIHQKRKPNEHEVVVVEDLMKTTQGNHSLLSNHAGQAFPPSYSKNGKRCAFPFRELSFRWDGSVSLCCDDFRGMYRVGNIHDYWIEDIWHHPRMYAARKKLYRGERDFGPCDGCTAVSYRVGLLPDPMGQEEYPKADKEDYKHIKNALKLGPYTKPVKRPWEKL